MIHLRPQRVYKPTTSSGNPNNSIANYLDRYYNQGLYRLRLETPRGTSLTEDNSQITCYAHVFNNTDGSEVTDRLKGRGFRPTWLLNDKPIDSTCISEDGYLLTLDSAHLTDYTQTVTLQALDTEILSALSDEPQFDVWLQQTLMGQGIQPTLLKQSETLINFALVNKKIKVGGRNLIRNGAEAKRQCGEFAVYRLYKPIEQSEPLTLSFDVIKVEKPPIGGLFFISFFHYSNFRTYASVKYEEGKKRYSVSIQALWYNYNLYEDKKGYDPDYVFIYPNDTYKSSSTPDVGCFTIANVKLERGTVATDWTPAPEDVEESVSKVNTSLTLLERSLLDPQQGRIQKLEDLLGKHSESFDALDSHPLTVDENGFWRIWSVKQQQYVTTHYPSRGEKGEDAGRYLGRAKRIHPDLIGNYLLETDTEFKWLTAKEGDYVYLVGDAPNRGGDKDTYYIVREHKSKTDWEVYNIKGHTPRLTLDEQFHLLADGERVSAISLKGPKGDKGEKGDKPKLSLDDKLRLLADGELVSMASLKGPKGDKGEPGHNPSPDDVLDSQEFQKLLESKVTTPFYNDLSITNKYIENAFTHINNIFTSMVSDRSYTITSSGYVSSRVAQTCPAIISKDYEPKHFECNIPSAEPQIRLVTYSDYESLKSQVVMLTSKLAQLEATNQITPITDCYVRAKRGSFGQVTDTLYPLYGDWLLTSDSKEQYISFGGLSAKIGKSIYIQTRKRAYLYANGHAFYGLPGSSVRDNQWLSNNTTYRFVRASSDSWLVTSSSSPYPWT